MREKSLFQIEGNRIKAHCLKLDAFAETIKFVNVNIDLISLFFVLTLYILTPSKMSNGENERKVELEIGRAWAFIIKKQKCNFVLSNHTSYNPSHHNWLCAGNIKLRYFLISRLVPERTIAISLVPTSRNK